MDTLELFKLRINKIKENAESVMDFKSSAVNSNSCKRVYNILNSNVKTINTYSKYINDINENSLGDHHQKYQILRQLMAYYDGNEIPAFSEKEKKRIDVRSSILAKAYKYFNDKSSFSRTFITFILALKSGYNLYNGTQYLLDSLPTELIRKYDVYLKQVLNDYNVTISNPVFGIYVLYSDPDLLDYYIDIFDEDESSFANNMSQFSSEPLFEERITNCQKSALRVEALLFSLYLMISNLSIENLNYNNVIIELINSLKIKLNNLNFENSNTIFRKFKLNELIELQDFLLTLNNNEKEEILYCLGNDLNVGTINDFKRSSNIPKANIIRSSGQGYDADTHTKSRRGQERFKRGLIASLNGSKPKCAICGCEITGKEYLVASHILPWGKSNAEQKVDPNNGLLLCPNHDFLFDSLLITFETDGKIIISDLLSTENRRGFRVDSTTKINLSAKKEVFMKLHREAFRNKRWK